LFFGYGLFIVLELIERFSIASVKYNFSSDFKLIQFSLTYYKLKNDKLYVYL